MPLTTLPLRIAVLAGGDSDERLISLKSGAAVEAALTQCGHRVLHLDPAIVELSGIDWSQFDVAFIALHGRFGEDGQVQQLLEVANVPYTGSDSAASRLAFSKSAAKEKFIQSGVPTPVYALIHYSDDLERVRRRASMLSYPLIVKPDTQGSSLGVSIVRNPEQLAAALKLCFQFDGFGILEKLIEGSEWTVGLIDSEILPAIKIVTQRDFFDWKAKYEDDSTQYQFDSGSTQSVVEAIQTVSQKACLALGTKGMARVDLRLDQNDQPWILEVNTIPGLTDHSLIPKAAGQMGIDFPTLCDRLVQSCCRKNALKPHILRGTRHRHAAEE